MILIYFPDKTIHYTIPGFGVVTTDGTTGNLLVDGQDTTTCAADVLWKYIADQSLEQDNYGFIHDADYYEEITPVQPRDLAAEMDIIQAVIDDMILGGV